MMKKSYGILSMILVLLFLVGCNHNVIIEEKSGNSLENKDSGENEISQSPVYYFYYGSYLGSFEDGEWYSPLDVFSLGLKTKEWTFREILKEKEYKLYNNSGFAQTISNLKVQLESGVGEFFGTEAHIKNSGDSNLMTQYRNEITALAKKVENESGEYLYDSFTLPVNLDEKYNDFVTNFDNSEFLDSENCVMTNAEFTIPCVVEEKDLVISDEVKNYLEQYKKQNGIAEDLEYSCESKYLVDINQDGNLDEIYVINSNIDPTSYLINQTEEIKYKGYFCMIVANVNHEIILIQEANAPAKNYAKDEFDVTLEKRIKDLGVFDLNHDNIYECVFTLGFWEGSYRLIASYQEGEYKIVTANYRGM